jgi:hypothetical protein
MPPPSPQTTPPPRAPLVACQLHASCASPALRGVLLTTTTFGGAAPRPWSSAPAWHDSTPPVLRGTTDGSAPSWGKGTGGSAWLDGEQCGILGHGRDAAGGMLAPAVLTPARRRLCRGRLAQQGRRPIPQSFVSNSAAVAGSHRSRVGGCGARFLSQSTCAQWPPATLAAPLLPHVRRALFGSQHHPIAPACYFMPPGATERAKRLPRRFASHELVGAVSTVFCQWCCAALELQETVGPSRKTRAHGGAGGTHCRASPASSPPPGRAVGAITFLQHAWCLWCRICEITFSTNRCR